MASKKASDSSPLSAADRFGQRRRGEGAGGDDDAVPVVGRQAGHFLAPQLDQRMGEQGLLDGGREAVTVDGQRAAGRQLVGVGRAHDQRAGAAHLLVQEADGVVDGIVGAEGVGADEFGEIFREMRLGAAHRPHLVQHDGHAGRRKLPRCLRAREAAAHDVHCVRA